MFWIIIGLFLVIPSLAFIVKRYMSGESHQDSYLTGLFGWPTLVSGIVMMVPTFLWWDFIIGFIAMAALEGWKFMTAKRKLAEHELARATKGEAV